MSVLSNGPDSQQAIIESFDQVYRVLNVRNIGGSLVPDTFDEIDLTYVPSGFGMGQIQTATYKLSGITMAILTISYNASNQISSVIRS